MSNNSKFQWWKYRNKYSARDSVLNEYNCDRDMLRRKVDLMDNRLTGVVGCLSYPSQGSDVNHVEAPVHAGYFRFSTQVNLTEVNETIGVKNMEFSHSQDMSTHVVDFQEHCAKNEWLFYVIGEVSVPSCEASSCYGFNQHDSSVAVGSNSTRV